MPTRGRRRRVPEGHPKIAQRFVAGRRGVRPRTGVPEGRLRVPHPAACTQRVPEGHPKIAQRFIAGPSKGIALAPGVPEGRLRCRPAACTQLCPGGTSENSYGAATASVRRVSRRDDPIIAQRFIAGTTKPPSMPESPGGTTELGERDGTFLREFSLSLRMEHQRTPTINARRNSENGFGHTWAGSPNRIE